MRRYTLKRNDHIKSVFNEHYDRCRSLTRSEAEPIQIEYDTWLQNNYPLYYVRVKLIRKYKDVKRHFEDYLLDYLLEYFTGVICGLLVGIWVVGLVTVIKWFL